MRHLIGLLLVDSQAFNGIHSLGTVFAISNYGFAFEGSQVISKKKRFPPKKGIPKPILV